MRRLAASIESEESGRRERDAMLAQLCLAEPRHRSLARAFASDRGARGRVLRLVDSTQSWDEGRRPDDGLLYTLDPDARSVTLTAGGQQRLEERLGPIFDAVVPGPSEPDEGLSLEERRRLRSVLAGRERRGYARLNQVHQALTAHVLLERGVDYVVEDGEIVLIDESTGRTLPENRCQRGLHAALEAKEGVEVRPERDVLARISVPGLVARYGHVSGVTGTAVDSEEELRRQYGLRVVRVAPHHGSRRTDHGHRLYETRADKVAAIVDEVRLCRAVGRPVLVGTLTVEQSEEISRALDDAGIAHNLLNAVTGEDEARIVRDAGAPGAVTVATNMAGRGTDVLPAPGLDRLVASGCLEHAKGLLLAGAGRVDLGFGSEAEAKFVASHALREPESPPVSRTGATVHYGIDHHRTLYKKTGLGLYVVGSELNASRRVDRQLWGRSGRQGAYGASRSILSLEDRMIAHGPGVPGRALRRPRRDEAGRVFHQGPAMTTHLENLQRRAADDDETVRRVAREYDRVLESQASAYYTARRETMDAGRLAEARGRVVERWAARTVARHFPGLVCRDYRARLRALADELALDYGLDAAGLEGAPLDDLAPRVGALLSAAIDRAASRLGADAFAYLETLLFLQASDELWIDHLANLEGLLRSVTANPVSHTPAVAEYAIAGFAEFERFKLRAVDAFLERLATLPAEDAPGGGRSETVSLDQEAASLITSGAA